VYDRIVLTTEQEPLNMRGQQPSGSCSCQCCTFRDPLHAREAFLCALGLAQKTCALKLRQCVLDSVSALRQRGLSGPVTRETALPDLIVETTATQAP